MPVSDLGGFYALFTNGVFGGDPGIDRDRISQAEGDERVAPDKADTLIGQLNAIEGNPPVERVFRPEVDAPDPDDLGDHFGLLVDPTEIADLVIWERDRLA
ncbi:hypothetical protein ACGFZP_07050 [Kitasatospora sp. NPDC048239]|uniref:hypothetical protein n=1 Tax=Kitasatospora sp. NPDC048239 TaxID=3364046 RepID=UPI003712C9D2